MEVMQMEIIHLPLLAMEVSDSRLVKLMHLVVVGSCSTTESPMTLQAVPMRLGEKQPMVARAVTHPLSAREEMVEKEEMAATPITLLTVPVQVANSDSSELGGLQATQAALQVLTGMSVLSSPSN
jgi:hypothetical protein